jgi:glycosyltransferase involved in cell wall biosynthesis
MPLIVLLTQQAPMTPERTATGVAVRHRLMTEALANAGVHLHLAWPEQGTPVGDTATLESLGVACHPCKDQDAFLRLLHEWRPSVVILGYWELAHWLPDEVSFALALDYVAPRWLESHFESPESEQSQRNAWLSLLRRCDEVWVGNQEQASALDAWLVIAGHDLRERMRSRIVPISNRCIEAPFFQLPTVTAGLRVLSAGQKWPWRRSQVWHQAIQQLPPDQLQLRILGDDGQLRSYADYLAVIDGSDIILELGDENAERHLAQSFRVVDALCRGRPVMISACMPMAERIVQAKAGWQVETPQQAVELLSYLSKHPESVRQAGQQAFRLAQQQFDADRVYGALASPVAALADAGPQAAPAPLADVKSGWRTALSAYRRGWVEHRLRRPLQRFWQHLASDRPLPSSGREAWVVLSRPDIFPVNHGAAVKIERTAWGLSFHVDEVLLLTDDRSGYRVYRRGEVSWQPFPLWLRCLGWPRKVNILRVLARGLPLSNAFLYLPLVDRSLQYRLLWVLRRHPVRVVQGEFPAYAAPAVWAARLFGCKSLMVEHNVEFARITEQETNVTPSEAEALKRVEVTLANACDRVITVSERDRQLLQQHGVQAGRLAMVPHGVDLQRFQDSAPVDVRARYNIPQAHAVLAYHGIYSYPPNADAVRELSSVLLPKLQARGISATVLAMGPKPLSETLPGVVFAGAVEDLAGHLKAADLAVIPLRQGGGTRMKILDDFAAGLPVVSTQKGMEGIDVTNGEELLVVDDAEAMADEVAALLRDQPRRQALAERASLWVAKMDWVAIAGRYADLMAD